MTVVVPCPGGTHYVMATGLPVGIWTNITSAAMQVPLVNYVTATGGICVDSGGALFVTTGGYKASDFSLFVGGIWRSRDQGTTFTKVSPSGCEQPIGVIVDPTNKNHLWAWCGVRGSGQGVWESTDNGDTWTLNAAFQTTAFSVGNADVYQMSADPGDFTHLTVSFHSPWTSGPSGVIQTTNGGSSWAVAGTTRSEWTNNGGYCVFFLHSPAHGIGNSSTWLFTTQGAGMWKTTNSGTTWTQVTTTSMAHGGAQPYYASDGALYIGSEHGILRSTNNGDSWSTTATMPDKWTYSAYGDGTHLFTLPDHGGSYLTAPETNGATGWGAYSAQQLPDTYAVGGFSAAFCQAYDPATHILYSALMGNGIWACKLS